MWYLGQLGSYVSTFSNLSSIFTMKTNLDQIGLNAFILKNHHLLTGVKTG
jgi:hypothetical protein